MGHHEEKHNGHHHSSDDSSDDDGHCLKKSAKRKESPRNKESHDEGSSSSSSTSSSSSLSSSSSSKSTSHHHHHHHHHGGDDGAPALGEEEEVVSPGKNDAEDNAPEGSLEETDFPATIEEEPAANLIEEIDHGPVSGESEGLSDRVVVEREGGMREESEDDESEVSDAPVYDKFLVVSSLKEDQKVEAKDGRRSGSVDEASLDKQVSGKKYNVVPSETVEGIHNAGKCDAPESAGEIVIPEPVKEIAKPETSEEPVAVAEPEEEDSSKEVVEENSVSSISEKRENSDAVMVEGEVDGHTDLTSNANSAPEETLEESVVSEFEWNGNAHEKTLVVWFHDEEESVKDVIEDSNNGQSSVSEEQAASLEGVQGGEQKGISAAVVLEGGGEGHAENSAPEATEEEPVEIEANGIALEGGIALDGPTNLEPEESNEFEGTSGNDDCLEGEDGRSKGPQSVRSHRDLIVELGSPLEHQKRLIRQLMTPSPPKRENSVYKIVMALEGLQVGEKCIHGEIDHGVCHQRYGDRRMSSSPSFSARAYRETSTSPKDEGESATSSFILGQGENAEVRVSDGEKKEVDSDWSFVQHDSQSGVTTQQTSTIKTQTYTDTVVFRRDDGFLPHTPGRSPLSGSQSMRAVFNQADASGSTTPRIKIVHEFPAEKDDSQESHDGASTSTLTTVEGESEVERILRLQETHDLVCPVCRSCITKRVILRKRKRTTVISTDKWVMEAQDEEEENTQEQAHDNVGDGDTIVEQYEDYGCLGCFTFLFRTERSVQRTQVVAVSSAAAEAAASVSVESTRQITDESAGRLPESVAVSPPALTDADYDNRCLPIFFTWRRKTISPTDAEVVAPLLNKEEKKTLSEESSVEVLQPQFRDVPAEDLPSETQEPAASEIQPSPASEIQPPSVSEILELPAAPGAVEGVQLPVVVVESREDRLCFPFLWRRASKTTQAQSELLQPLLEKEVVKHQSDVAELQSRDIKKNSVDVEQQSKEIKQESGEVKRHNEEVEQETEDFSRIEDDLWMRQEVLLEVPVSVPPQEKLTTPGSSRTPDSSETAAESDTSFKAIRVTEAERRVDCLCFPSWSSSETTSEETESSRITDSLQVVPVASGSEASEIISPSTALKKAVSSVTSGTEGAEILLISPSLKGAVLPVASSTEDRETQRASLNCMDILIPSYPWGPPGTGSRREVLGRAEEHSGSATSTQFEFSTVGQVLDKGVVVLPEQVVSEGFTKLGSQAKKPQEEIFLLQTTTGSVKEPESQSKESQGVIDMENIPKGGGLSENEISTMRTAYSRCLPLLLPSISWRRQELTTEEILDQSSKTKTAEIKSSVTSEKKSSMVSEINSCVALESQSSETAETSISQEKEVEKEINFGDIEINFGDIEINFGDLEVSRNQNQQINQIHNDIVAEVVDEEEVPLVRKPPTSKLLTPSKVEPLPAEEGPPVIVSVETDDSSLPEVLERDLSFSQDLTRTPNLPRVLPVDETFDEESREEGSWNCCLPSHSQLASQSSISQDVTRAPSSPTVLPVDETHEEERREKGSWNCCLPSYAQLAYQPIEGSDIADRVTGEQAAPAFSGGLFGPTDSQISDESESIFHEEVTRETTIDARITTETTTTKSHTDATKGESIDAVRIDTSVSYVHASVQHDEGAVEGTLHLDDHPTFSLQPANKLPAAPVLEEEQKPLTQPPLGPTYSTGYAALSRFLEDEEEDADADAAVNEWLVDSSRQGVPWKEVEPLKPATEVEQENGEEVSMLPSSSEENFGEEITLSEAVTEVKVPPVLSDSIKQGIGRKIARADVQRTQVQMPDLHEEEDRSYCLPNSKWLWGRPKLTYEAVQLREPLLGRDTAQFQESGIILQRDSEMDSKDSAHVTAQLTHERTGTTASSTAARVSEEEECSCLPWSGRRYNLEAQLREPLLGRDTVSQLPQPGLLQRDSEVDSKSDSSAHVTIEQTHEVTHTTTVPTAERLRDEKECNCFPWSGRYYRDTTDVETTVTVTLDDTVIEVEGTDAAITLAAATAAAEDAGMMDEQLLQEPEYLKSIVYGGLDVSLTSLGVVASAAGGDAKTRNVLALGLANLIFGFIAFYYKIQDLHKESPARFQQSVGPRFWINGPLAMISFLFFGALPVFAFGFSFRELNDHDYKMAATVLVSTIAIVILGCGKVAAKMTELSYRRTVITLISTGLVAAVAGFYTGEYISKLLEKYGILDE